jgi:hypothetical protein
MGASRKNAADIKMAVDAMVLAFERDYISTFVFGTGDSDFTPLVHKLRELNKRVIGVGVERTTSALLPPACDEFLYYDRLEGVEIPSSGVRGSRTRPREVPQTTEQEPELQPSADRPARDVDTLTGLVAQTVAGLQGSSGGAVTASTLKRTLLRKDPTFNEADYGFRAFGELLRFLAEHNIVELVEGPAKGDPEVSLPEHGDREAAFGLLGSLVADLSRNEGSVALSGLKNQLRRRQPEFSEKKLGYRSFLQFCKAAATSGVVDLRWDRPVTTTRSLPRHNAERIRPRRLRINEIDTASDFGTAPRACPTGAPNRQSGVPIGTTPASQPPMFRPRVAVSWSQRCPLSGPGKPGPSIPDELRKLWFRTGTMPPGNGAAGRCRAGDRCRAGMCEAPVP